jgi:spore maturation protein CgeB/GT2 family glycosyltransferase
LNIDNQKVRQSCYLHIEIRSYSAYNRTGYVVTAAIEISISPNLSRNRMDFAGLTGSSEGYLEGMNQRVVRGWVRCTENSATAKLVEIWDNDRLIATVRAWRTRVDNVPQTNHVYKEFAYELMPELLDGKDHVLRARLVGSKGFLPGKDIIFDGRRTLEGYFERIEDQAAIGWILDHSDKASTIDVDIYVDGNMVLSAIPASNFREDVMIAKSSHGFHGFSVSLAAFLQPSITHEISVTTSFDGVELIGSPLKIEIIEKPILRTRQPSEYDGFLDAVNGHIIGGWAFDTKNIDDSVNVDLYIDNTFITSNAASNFRADLVRAKKGTGKYGFNFEIPERYFDGREHKFDVKFAGTDQSLKKSPYLTYLGPAGVAHSSFQEDRKITEAFYTTNEKNVYRQKQEYRSHPDHLVSIIVLNQNGENLLRDLIHSFKNINTYKNFEFIFVDHASTDRSLAVMEELCGGMRHKVLAYDQNHSFSYSNNQAARIASGDILFFLNNDIIFSQDVIADLSQILDDPEVGVVGVKLADILYHNGDLASPSVQHLGVQFGINRHNQELVAYEVRPTDSTLARLNSRMVVPATTGAAMLARKEDFLAVGGFNEDYFYGLEDIDLCLSVTKELGLKVITANDLVLLHHRGYSRYNADAEFSARASGNKQNFQRRLGYHTRKKYLESLYRADDFWAGSRLKVAFAVSEARFSTAKADFFTAYELGDELARQFGWQVYYLEQGDNWYDVADIDILVVMRDDYHLNELKNAKPTLIKIAWARNWFDRWLQRPWYRQYDLCLASSEKACAFMTENSTVESRLLRIGGNDRKFSEGKFQQQYKSDYCFTGSFFGQRRDIITRLQPDNLPFEFALFGHGWEAFKQFNSHYRGALGYGEMPHVYASTKILVDDANHVTKEWGATNSRVFDAIAAGVLVITNSELSSFECFDGLLPVYRSTSELEDILAYYLEHETERNELVAKLRNILKERHTYSKRGREFFSHMEDFFVGAKKVAIKVPAPNWNEIKQWGDYHYALALKRSFEGRGYAVRIDILPDWHAKKSAFDDVVIVLRGLSQYKPNPAQINIMWNISHPDTISDAEYNLYDHVFVASDHHALELKRRLTAPVTALLQCADQQVFYRAEEAEQIESEVLFVGNSRNVFRQIVKDAFEKELPLEVIGNGWGNFLPPGRISQNHVENTELHKYYSGSKILLNDHWASMARMGFISNRIFDAGLCGAFIISDDVTGMKELFGDAIELYEDAADLERKVRYYLDNPELRKEKGQQLRRLVLEQHTFEHRVKVMDRVVIELLNEKFGYQNERDAQ